MIRQSENDFCFYQSLKARKKPKTTRRIRKEQVVRESNGEVHAWSYKPKQ
jgi:hypothetical protein